MEGPPLPPFKRYTPRPHEISHYNVEIRGKRVSLKAVRKHPPKPHTRERGIITDFSRRARARKLRRIAEVNWADTGPTQFLTVTYPDKQADHTMQERKVHRFLLNRFICGEVGRPLACFWRVEWMPRLSGECVGQLRPHMHFLYLNTPQLSEKRIRAKWQSIIAAEQFVQVKVKTLRQSEKVAVYVSKYCAKEQTDYHLDNVPKRNRSGRHAGELRSNLIPLHPLELIEKIDDAMLRFLKCRACDTLWWYDPRFDEGFTILGNEALELIREIHEGGLAYTGRKP